MEGDVGGGTERSEGGTVIRIDNVTIVGIFATLVSTMNSSDRKLKRRP